MRKASSEKILILGVDGLDPSISRKFIDEGLMPNLAEFESVGAQRKDLVLLGGHPTVTPPMWTTLACGCYANVHGITGFYRTNSELPDETGYNLDSRLCRAEPLWNVFAEAGKKTLVFHWPGSSWPPTSDNENLYVLDGSSPGSVGTAIAQVERDYVIVASEKITEVRYLSAGATDMTAPCLITDLETEQNDENNPFADVTDIGAIADNKMSALYIPQAIPALDLPLDVAQSPIKTASGWGNSLPNGAKEFTLLFSGGLVRRPALILQNEQGEYDHIAIYKSKKEDIPLAVIKNGEMYRDYIDVVHKNDKVYNANRDIKVMHLEKDGSNLKLYVSAAMDYENDHFYHPHELYTMLKEHAGFCPPTAAIHLQDKDLHNAQFDCWDHVVDWYVKGLQYLMDEEKFDVIFSHMHNVDMCEHTFISHLYDKGYNKFSVETYQQWLKELYQQTDRYLGNFLRYLDEGWSIVILSDHGLSCGNHSPLGIGCMSGVNIEIMEKLGYTVPIRNEKGIITGLDWSKTTAVATQANDIFLNLKGRQKYGIVEPTDKYALEEKIITDLYGIKHPQSGNRVVALALHNKDAVLLGYGGEYCGDICYWMAEEYCNDHCDGLATTKGVYDTSQSPIFLAAGKGFKQGFTTDRIIRQVDVAPTLAVLGGVRMPEQCEGAPIYQILAEQY